MIEDIALVVYLTIHLGFIATIVFFIIRGFIKLFRRS